MKSPFTNKQERPDNRTTRRKQRGFTLMEVLISMGFMASLAGLISGSSFLAIRTRIETGAVADVAVETAKTTRWLVRDVHKSATTNLVDLGPPVATATFDWDDGGPVSCNYSVIGTDLVRNCGTSTNTVGKFINNFSFVRAGSLITVSYQIIPPTALDKAQSVDLNIALGGG